MPVDVFESKWQCHKCDAIMLGREERCSRCRKFKDDKDIELAAVDLGPGQGLTDPELLKKFKGGADWVCYYCGGHSRNSMGDCLTCGGGQAEGTSRADRIENDRGQEIKDAQDAAVRAYNAKRGYTPTPLEDLPIEPPPPPLVGGDYRTPPRPESTTKKVVKEAALNARVGWAGVTDAYEEGRDDIREALFRSRFPWEKLIIGAALVALIAGLVYLLLPREYTANVDSVSWVHTVIVDRYSVHQHDGFEPTPGSFDLRDLGRRIHHYDTVLDHYETEHRTRRVSCGQDCKPVESCRTTPRSCSNNKNGSITCSGGDRVCTTRTDCTTRYCNESYTVQEPKYREDPVYRNYYQWNIWEWAEHRRVAETGRTTETFWPTEEKVALNVGLKTGESERVREQGAYKVTFAVDSERYNYNPELLSEFRRYALGRKYRIKVALGRVTVLGEAQ